MSGPDGGWDTARAAASAAGIPVKLATGPTLETIVAEAGQPDVTAVVLGTRGAQGDGGPPATSPWVSRPLS